MSRSAWMGLAVTIAALGLPGAAVAQTAPSNSLQTRSMVLYLKEARSAGHPDDRASALARALEVGLEGTEKDADNPQVWFLLGQVHLEQDNLQAADSAFDRAETLWPDYTAETRALRENAWVNAYNQGVQALQRDDDAAALAAFQRATMIFDGRPEALMSLASLHAASGNSAEAEAAYREALALLREPAAADLNAAATADWVENEEVAAFNLARLLADQQKYDEAALIFQEFSARHPESVQASVNLGLMYARAGKAQEAAAVYARLLEQPGLDEIDYFNLGVGLYRADRHEEAATAFSKAVALNPYSRDALYNLAQAQFAHANDLLEAGDTVAATSAFTQLAATAGQVIALDPAAQQAHMLLAQSQRTRADLEDSDALRQDALATLETANALPFRVEGVQMDVGAGVTTVTGNVVNGTTLTAGTPTHLVITLLDRTGAELATQTVPVTLGPADAAVAFTAEIPVQGAVAGWKYTIAP